MSERMSARNMLLVVIPLLAVLLLGQLASDNLAPNSASVGTGEAVGRTAFAYLSGVRVFGAQVLWNRIEPLLHEYYDGVALQDQTYMLPTLNAINMLDPQFDQPYYIAPWILARRGDVDEALEVAERGVNNNPRSGLLRTSYAQMIQLFAEDTDEALVQADLARSDDMVWADDIEKHDSYSILRYIYRAHGKDDVSGVLLVEIERLDARIGDEISEEGHDHDGDGVSDH